MTLHYHASAYGDDILCIRPVMANFLSLMCQHLVNPSVMWIRGQEPETSPTKTNLPRYNARKGVTSATRVISHLGTKQSQRLRLVPEPRPINTASKSLYPVARFRLMIMDF